ncbi:PRA1 family protein [Vairimorpha necatrix]|uniref:PRA1 family protein n=1 Tax=Vairimorpha necatrix TaxID=6039 RepID=A0AAX4JGV6_9MICR
MEEKSQTPKVQNVFTNLMSSKTPPKEFFNLNKTSVPQNWDTAKKRISNNLEKFKTFYSSISLIFLFIFIVFNPSVVLLLGICGLCAYGNMYTPTIQGFECTKVVTNSATLGLFLLYIVVFPRTMTLILALVSLVSLGIVTHSVTLEEDEIQEDV